MGSIIKLETECKENRNTRRITIQYYVYEQDGRYIAYCPALDMTSTGDDLNDVITQFYEHFQLYIECCIEDNTLLDDLKAHGWKLNGVTITPPKSHIEKALEEAKKAGSLVPFTQQMNL